MLAIVQFFIDMRADAHALQQRGFFPVNLHKIVGWTSGCTIRRAPYSFIYCLADFSEGRNVQSGDQLDMKLVNVR